MIFTQTLKRFCDFCFYMTFASFIGLMFGGDNLMVAAPIFGLTAFLAIWLIPRGRLKYLPLLMLPLIFLWVPLTLPNGAVLLPIAIYLGKSIPSGPEQFDYTDIFSLFIKIFFAFLILVAITRQLALFEVSTVPFGILFLGSAIIFMRMSRHDEDILGQTRFKLINALSLAVLLGVGFMLSNPDVLSAVSSVLGFLYREVLMRGFLAVLWAILWVLGRIFPSIHLQGLEDMPWPTGPVEGEGDMPLPEDLDIVPNPMVAVIINAILVIATVVVLYILFKKMSKKSAFTPKEEGLIETRTHLTAPKKSRKRSENQVRELYRKFLVHCQQQEVAIRHYMTTADIEEEALAAFHCPKSRELRQLYIETRYGNRPITKDDVRHAKSLFHAIIKNK